MSSRHFHNVPRERYRHRLYVVCPVPQLNFSISTLSTGRPRFPLRLLSQLGHPFFSVTSKDTSTCDVTVRDPHPTQARRQFRSCPVFNGKGSLRQLLADVSRSRFQFFTVRGLGFLGHNTFASKSKALATDFDIPSNSHASSKRPRAKDSSSSSAAAEILSFASVPRTTAFSWKERVLCSHSVLSCIV